MNINAARSVVADVITRTGDAPGPERVQAWWEVLVEQDGEVGLLGLHFSAVDPARHRRVPAQVGRVDVQDACVEERHTHISVRTPANTHTQINIQNQITSDSNVTDATLTDQTAMRRLARKEQHKDCEWKSVSVMSSAEPLCTSSASLMKHRTDIQQHLCVSLLLAWSTTQVHKRTDYCPLTQGLACLISAPV